MLTAVHDEQSQLIDAPCGLVSNAERPCIRAALIFAAASIITAWLVWSCGRLETSYVSHYGYFYDAAAYLRLHLALHESQATIGTWPTILWELASDDRCLMRTVPYLCLAPHLLTVESGHLWTEIPFFFSLVFLLGSLISRRTGSPFFALAAMSTFVAIPYFYDPMHGIAAFWLDLTAAFALGCCVLSLAYFLETGQARWMLAFGLFGSSAVLCRWWCTGFVVPFAAVALPVVLADHRFRLKAKLSYSLISLLSALPGIVFAIKSLPSAWAYYKVAGCALNHTILESAGWLAASLPIMVGAPVLSVLVALIGCNLTNWIKHRQEWQLNSVCLGLPAVLFCVTCLVCRIYQGEHALSYFLPALVIAAFVPIKLNSIRKRNWTLLLSIVSFALFSLNCGCAALAYEKFRKLAKNPSPVSELQKRTDVEIASVIAATGCKTFLEFDTQTIYPQLEAFYRYGIYCPESTCFSIHEYHMKGRYPNKSARSVAQAAYEDVCQTVELVAVFADPKEAVGKFNNSFSETTAAYVSKAVKNDSLSLNCSWREVKRVFSPRGWLVIYQNELLLNRRSNHHPR